MISLRETWKKFWTTWCAFGEVAAALNATCAAIVGKLAEDDGDIVKS